MTAAPLQISAAVATPDLLGGGLVGEPYACLGIDLHAADSAPTGELIRIDYSANDDHSAALAVALQFLGFLYPVVVSRGQLVRILHDLENARVVLAAIQSDAESTNRRASHDLSSVDGVAIVDGSGRAGDSQGLNSPASLGFSHPLRGFREANDLTAEAMAQKLGCSKASVSRIETGDHLPSPALARAIHAITGIGLWDLRPDIWERPQSANHAGPTTQGEVAA